MRKYRHSPDMFLFLITTVLVIFGVMMIYNASAIMAEKRFGDSALFLKKQFSWAVLGLFLMICASKIDYNKLWKLSPYILFVSAALLIFVLIAGKRVGGATRWLKIGFFTFQPSEFAKLSIIIYLARSLDKKRDKIKDFKKGVLPHLIILGIFCFLILAEPDFGGTVVLASVGLVMFFMGGMRISHLIYIGLSSLPLVVFIIGKTAYRRRRILSFMDPWADPQAKGYQIIQSLYALGRGGLFGQGLGNSKQKLLYLPEPHTDFIFPVIGEEWGLIGTLTILGAFIFFAWRGYKISLKAPNLFGSLLAAGITFAIVFQAILNIAVVTACLPTKGMPLPFLSFGGSALIFNLIGVGILLNISRQMKR